MKRKRGEVREIADSSPWIFRKIEEDEEWKGTTLITCLHWEWRQTGAQAERSKARVRIGVGSGGGKDIMPKNGTKGVVTIDFPVRACLLEVSHFLWSLHTRSRPT